MPTSAAFQSTYLTPGAPNAVIGPTRFGVAGALYSLQEQLKMGASAANAQAHAYAGQKRNQQRLAKAVPNTPAGATLVTDFQAIDSL